MGMLDRALQVKANFTLNVQVLAVTTSPGWQMIAAFQSDEDARVRLEAIGALSGAGLTLRSRLHVASSLDPLPLSTTEQTTPGVLTVLSKPFNVSAGTTYEVVAECTGSANPDDFGLVHSVRVLRVVEAA